MHIIINASPRYGIYKTKIFWLNTVFIKTDLWITKDSNRRNYCNFATWNECNMTTSYDKEILKTFRNTNSFTGKNNSYLFRKPVDVMLNQSSYPKTAISRNFLFLNLVNAMAQFFVLIHRIWCVKNTSNSTN